MRHPSSYKRRAPRREPYDYLLIVCEGGKTEPNYFHGLRRAHNLSSTNVEIARPGKNDPIGIVEYADKRLNETDFDRAYCVFDRNGHVGFDSALAKVAKSINGKNGRLHAIPSVPCFEIWILLHFIYSAAPFTGTGSQSACDKVIAKVKEYLPEYHKGQESIYDLLDSTVAQGIVNARRLENENAKTGSLNPATQMHQVVDFLQKLKRYKPPQG